VEAVVRSKVTAPGAETDAQDGVRASAYALLGALLVNPPTSDLLARVQTVDAAHAGAGGLAGAWTHLRAAAQSASRDAVAAEYHELFIGLGRGELVPYGSYYLTGFLMEMPLGRLRADLANLGFERRDGVNEPEDHAGALCETMSLIIDGGDAVPFETQQAFFAEHVESWMGKFFHDLELAESACFYRAVGELGARFIEFESRYLSMLA